MARIERADNMRSIREILKEAVTLNASDIFIVTGTPVSFKVFGNVMRLSLIHISEPTRPY